MGSKKQWAIFLTATVLTVCLLAVTVLVCAGQAGKAMRQHSFDELAASGRHLAEDYYSTIKNDQMFLSAIAELIARQKLSDVDTLLRVMNSFSFEESFLTQLILLMPDGQLLHSDGTWYDVSDRVDFAEEARKGAYISDRVASLFAPEQQVVRSAMPVKRNGETVAILYGVIFLTESRRAYSSDYYSGNAFILVIDGNTGDILLDTWHDTLGNLADMSDRKMLDDYTYEEAAENLRLGRSGDVRSVSKTTGGIINLHYEPVGINNWSVTIGVSEKDALAGTRGGVQALYSMAAVIGVLLVGYLAYVAGYLIRGWRSIYRQSLIDPGTGLLNRIAFEAYLQKNEDTVFAPAACVYIDANGLHEINNQYGHEAGDRMLQMLAELLREQFPGGGLYRVGGDEMVIFPAQEEDCRPRMSAVARHLAARGYSIAYGIATAQSTVACGRWSGRRIPGCWRKNAPTMPAGPGGRPGAERRLRALQPKRRKGGACKWNRSGNSCIPRQGRSCARARFLNGWRLAALRRPSSRRRGSSTPASVWTAPARWASAQSAMPSSIC